MKARIITRTQALSTTLVRLARAEGLNVIETQARSPGRPLAALLQGADGQVVVVEAEDASADIAELEGWCAATPAQPLILLSANRESDLLLHAMRAGIREVLPNPPGEAEFSAALRRVLQRTSPNGGTAARARVIAFVACKGGSGATFLATNLGYVLASEHHQRVALIDVDLQYGDAAYFVTDAPVRSSLADVARQVDRLDASLLAASMIHVTDTFNLLPAPEEPEAALGITGFQMDRVLAVARESHDFVIVDVERMLEPVAIRALDQAELVYLVTENMIPHVRDARRLVRILRALGYADQKLRLIVNRQDRHAGVELERLEQAIGLKASWCIPDRPQDVGEAVNAGVSLVQVHPHSPVSRALREIAAGLTQREPPPHRSWLGRLVGEGA